ncbi:MAG: AAA family ATPase, partial [Crocinitomicaceae bacterium]|nr:AAA family ATPase [Crocinitomicaceae bacterium]
MSIQKYPIGHQDFAKIITEGFVYVDKTHFVHRLVERGGYYFLSRPRRFGKSLLVSTLEYLFKGKKELFEGLYIYDKWEFEEYPVIKISFANIGYREIPLEEAIIDHLESISIQCDTKINLKSASVAFKDLIVKLHQKFNQKVVVLIDEYDKPLIDYLDKENLHKAIENRAILKSFYSVLKDADAHLKMVFISGVSKFSQVSIFSDLNNLYDLTLKSEYNEICGISQVELEHHFAEELKIYDKSRIKDWYNGYRWNVNGDTIYNPFSILNFFTGDGALRDEVGYYRITG